MPIKLAQDLGGASKVPQAFEAMRQACRKAGFDGLYLLGEYRGLDPKELRFRKDLGLTTRLHIAGLSTIHRRRSRPNLISSARLETSTFLRKSLPFPKAGADGATKGPLYKIRRRTMKAPAPSQRNHRHDAEEGVGQQVASPGQLERMERRTLPRPPSRIRVWLFGRCAKCVLKCERETKDVTPAEIGLGPYDLAYKAWKK